MPPIHDIARYGYPGHRTEAACHLRIWPREGETVAMVSELADNPGASVTQRIEALAMQVCREFELWPSRTRWIEHYPPGASRPEGFAEVTFTLDPHAGLSRPRWHPRTRAEVEALIGESLPSPEDWRARVEGRSDAHRSLWKRNLPLPVEREPSTTRTAPVGF